ncbi:tripartite motif-containing protein 59 [Scleropages formosus]|uniref:Tripartite motif containing 59 n=1 Tax=Scleropages formosus TaxID=113540 RepID=A0A8C9UYB9_SCLFO|nr:tripartite motif-containing protein 59 [Scleropages formosus]XP_018588145.1 tripartite motif-containing protein 59 [Scleropages formosus]
MDNLEEDLTCSVCYSLFSDPRVLPCSHTFCRACLESVLQVSGNFSIWRPLRIPLKCPNCRSMVELPPSGVDALPINVSLRAIIEKFQRDSQPRLPTCVEHPRQPLNVYCVQDRKLICGFCLTVGQHQGHTIDDLQTAYIKERETPARLIEQLTDKRWTEVCALAEQLEQEKARCESLLQQDRDAVSQFFQGIDRILARKKAAFMEALDKANAELSRIYDPLIDELKDMKEEQLDLISYSSAVETEDSPLAFLEKVHLFQERVEALSKAPLPRVKAVCIHPRAGRFLEERWAGMTIADLEQGQIPHISCCSEGCCRKEAASRSWSPEWPAAPSPVAALLVLLLLSFVLLGFSFSYPFTFGLPQLNQLLQAFVHGLSGNVCVLKETLWCWQSTLGDTILRCRILLSSLGETTTNYVGSIYRMF